MKDQSQPTYQSPTVISYDAQTLMQQLGAARAFSEAPPEDDWFRSD